MQKYYVVGERDYEQDTALGNAMRRFNKRMQIFGRKIFPKDKNPEIDHEHLKLIFSRPVGAIGDL